jgi:glucokinase
MESNSPRVLGIDVGGTSVKMGILDPVAGLVDVKRIDTIPNEPELMAEKIGALAAGYSPDYVGVGTAGRVNVETGLVTASNLGWTNLPLRAILEKRIGTPVWVDNDAQAAMMAESHSGVLKGVRCAVYLTLGTGIGGALLLDRQPWRGVDNTAFELGHIVTHADGQPCPCGKKGCYERYASVTALSRMAGGKPARDVLDEIIAGEPEALAIFGGYLHELAVGLLTVIALFNPEVIALGGGMTVLGDRLLTGIREALAELISNHSVGYRGQIHLAAHQNDAGMIGAAALAERKLFPQKEPA